MSGRHRFMRYIETVWGRGWMLREPSEAVGLRKQR
jgi:hypothetical protein